MDRSRTPGDDARYRIYLRRKYLLDSGRDFLSKEECAQDNASFSDVLANASAEDIARIPDDDAIDIADYYNEDGEPIWPRDGSLLLRHFIGWDSGDVFFTMTNAPEVGPRPNEETAVQAEPAEAESQPARAEVGTKPRGGRKAAPWWPELTAQLAFIVYEDGLPESQSELIAKVQERVAAKGFDEPSRPSVQKAVSRLYQEIAASGSSSK